MCDDGRLVGIGWLCRNRSRFWNIPTLESPVGNYRKRETSKNLELVPYIIVRSTISVASKCNSSNASQSEIIVVIIAEQGSKDLSKVCLEKYGDKSPAGVYCSNTKCIQ